MIFYKCIHRVPDIIENPRVYIILDRSVWKGCSVHPSFCSNKETETWDSVRRTRPCCPVFVKTGPVEMEISNLLFLRHLQIWVVWRPGWIMLLALIWTLPGQVHHRSGVKIQRGDYPLLWPLFLSVHQHPQAGAYLVTPASVAESDMKVHLDIMGGTIRRGRYCMPSTHVRTLAQLFGSFRNNRNMREPALVRLLPNQLYFASILKTSYKRATDM